MVAVSNHIPSTRVQIQTTCELIVIKLTLHPDTFICCTYVPPSSPTSYYENLIHSLHSLPSSSHFILLGDFNITDVNWSTFHSTSPSSSTFCDLLFSLNMLQLVNAPTHSLGNTLDLIFSNCPNLISNLTVSSTCINISDHHLISFHLSNTRFSSFSSPPRFIWNYSKANLDGLHSHLFNSNLDVCLQSDGVNIIWNHIKDHISAACHLFVPKV